MFIQDMYQGIMPYTHEVTQGSGFAVNLDRGDAELERTVAAALCGGGYRYNLAGALRDFVRDAAQELFTYGRVAYEIVCDTDLAGVRNSFKFVSIHPLSLKKFSWPLLPGHSLVGCEVFALQGWYHKVANRKNTLYRLSETAWRAQADKTDTEKACGSRKRGSPRLSYKSDEKQRELRL